MAHPVVILHINGQPVSDVFYSRLISVSVTDKEGSSSDSIEIEMEAGQPYPERPQKKAVITCWIGANAEEVDEFGPFEVNDVEKEIFPWKMKIHGKAADMKSSLKQHRDKHYDKTDLGKVFKKIAARHGLEAQIDPEIAAQARDYLCQMGESDLHFGERLARSVDGLFALKGGKLIVAKKGSGQSPSGTDMPVTVITPERLVKHTTRIQWGERETHKKVKAHHHNHKTGKRETEEADGDPGGESEYTLRHPYGTKAEAKAAAEAKANDLGRNADSAACTIEGCAYVKGGGPMEFAVGDPDVDGQAFIMETVTHNISVQKRAYVVSIQARNPSKEPGKSGKFKGPRTIGGKPRAKM